MALEVGRSGYTFCLRTAQLPGQCNQTVNTLSQKTSASQIRGLSMLTSVWTNLLLSVGHGQGKDKKMETFGQNVMAWNWLNLQYFRHCYIIEDKCSIANSLCNQRCCCWPHSDQTGHGFICYEFICDITEGPSIPFPSQSTQLESNESGPWERFQHITGKRSLKLVSLSAPSRHQLCGGK